MEGLGIVRNVLVSVPANPDAGVMERAFAKDGRVLAGVHADALERAHKRRSGTKSDIASVLAAAGRMGDDGDPEDDEDYELSFEAARRKRAQTRGGSSVDHDVEYRKRVLALAKLGIDPKDTVAERRKRLVQIAGMRFGPLSSAEAGAVDRARLIARMRRGP